MPFNSIWIGEPANGFCSGIGLGLPCMIHLLVLPPDAEFVDAPHEFMHLFEPGFLILELLEESLNQDAVAAEMLVEMALPTHDLECGSRSLQRHDTRINNPKGQDKAKVGDQDQTADHIGC